MDKIFHTLLAKIPQATCSCMVSKMWKFDQSMLQECRASIIKEAGRRKLQKRRKVRDDLAQTLKFTDKEMELQTWRLFETTAPGFGFSPNLSLKKKKTLLSFWWSLPLPSTPQNIWALLLIFWVVYDCNTWGNFRWDQKPQPSFRNGSGKTWRSEMVKVTQPERRVRAGAEILLP